MAAFVASFSVRIALSVTPFICAVLAIRVVKSVPWLPKKAFIVDFESSPALSVWKRLAF